MNNLQNNPQVWFPAICAISVFCGYIFTYGSESARQVPLLLMYFSSVIWGCLSIRHLVKMLKFRLTLSRKHRIYFDFPDLEMLKNLADEMKVKLNKKHPFALTEGLDNAFYDPLHGRIVLGETIINKLETAERLALAAHELTHVKKNHYFIQFAGLPFILFIFVALTLRRELDWIFGLVFIASFCMLFPIVSRRMEYQADAGAASKTRIDVVISQLRKTEDPKRWGRETVTHPSTNSRVNRLIRQN